jgi:hypothetical protein
VQKREKDLGTEFVENVSLLILKMEAIVSTEASVNCTAGYGTLYFNKFINLQS